MSETPTAEIHNQPLSSFCKYFDNNEKEVETGNVDKFVGIRYLNEKFEIHFPVGYEEQTAPQAGGLQTDAASPLDEKARAVSLRKDILNLISILSSYGEKSEMLSLSNASVKTYNTVFPIHAYMFIVVDFLNRGYYKQKECYYTKSPVGKINWARTIKQVRPSIINDNVYYFNFITKRTNYNESELLTQIHKYCVEECFNKIGFLFCAFRSEKTPVKLNKKLFNAVIKSKASKTFNEKELLLLKNMFDVINFQDEDNNKHDFVYGTNHFHIIWEKLVDEVYGESDKEKFYPKVYWRIPDDNTKVFTFNDAAKRASLRPDTIMITNRGNKKQKIYILDSKYYRYGATGIANTLPGSESIVKQIAYGKYVEKQKDKEHRAEKFPIEVGENLDKKNIFNAFILPSNPINNESHLKNIGYASSDFIDENDKPYYKIYGILLNTRYLMEHHKKHDDDAINALSKLIEQK